MPVLLNDWSILDRWRIIKLLVVLKNVSQW